MGADKSISWSPPAVDLRLLPQLGLPSLLRLLPGKSPTSQSPLPLQSPLAPQSPCESRSNALIDLRTTLIKSLQSIIPFVPASPTPRRRHIPTWPPEAGCAVPRFRPYVAKVPWHGGVRAFLSQLFPRYGHYCGPNWSSGKDGGSMLWDRRPIDWLDFCCYCHDIGYDTHDQSKLLKADLAFLECLERPQVASKGGAHISFLYRSMCIAGLRYLLIPYRMQLLRVQSGPSFTEVFNNWTGKVNMFKQNLDGKCL
ncbi:hypothetical protein IEQ34_005911 [Dendrobium chrysotoxum]|uniref:Phospholipase A2 family protein n=1 Tax=Dendrobium chrysotoxum TaxID=161865 RepID=A0AAV7HCR3_DENCH|nr:hypothetical protein IEQ34_005911 [Dendrobium chrysotoxum]